MLASVLRIGKSSRTQTRRLQLVAAANSVKKKSYWHLIKGSVLQWIEDEPFSLAAALSYYTLFSLAPLLVIAIAVAGFAFGREAAQNQVVAALQGMIGEESAQAVQGGC